MARQLGPDSRIDIKVADEEDLVKMAARAEDMVRGLDFACAGCGSRIEVTNTSAQSSHSATLQVQPAGASATVQIIERLDGVWAFLDNDEASILNTLDHDSDRAMAIIVAAVIESRLERTLRSRMQPDKKIHDRMFRAAGPLGAFSAKIDLARLIGAITAEAHHDLIALRDIRNAFAHDLSVKDFRSKRIKDKSAKFALIESYVAEVRMDPAGGQMQFADLAYGAAPALYVRHFDMKRKAARDRYLMTAQRLTIKFAPAALPNCQWPMV